MRSWASFESSISAANAAASSSSAFSFPTPSPRISPRKSTQGQGSFFSSSIPPSTPTHPPPPSPFHTSFPPPSTPHPPPPSSTSSTSSPFFPSTPSFHRQPSSSTLFTPQPLPSQALPPSSTASSAFPPTSSTFGPFSTPPSSSTSSSSSATLPPFSRTPSLPPPAVANPTPSSSARLSSRPFSSYSTFPSLSASKPLPLSLQASFSSSPSSSFPSPHSPAPPANNRPPPSAIRSLITPSLTPHHPSSSSSSSPLPTSLASLASTLHCSLLHPQYLAWKAVDRQSRLSDFLLLFLPLLLALLAAFTLTLTPPPWQHLSLRATTLLLCWLAVQGVVSLLHVRALLASPLVRVSVAGVRVPMPNPSDLLLCALHVGAPLVGVVLLYWAQPAVDAAVSSTSRAIAWWGILLAPLSLTAYLVLSRPSLSFSSPTLSSTTVLRRVVPAAVEDAALRAVLHCVAVIVGVVGWRWVLGPLLGWAVGHPLVGEEVSGSWAGFFSMVLKLLEVTLLSFLCTALSLRLLAVVLTRPVAFSLPHLLLAVYDSADRLYRRLGLSWLCVLLSSPSTRRLLFSSLPALFPDLPSISPSSTSLTTVDAVATAALHPLSQLLSLLHQRTSRLQRRRLQAQQMLLQRVDDVAAVVEEDEAIQLQLEEAVEWVQVATGLLEAAADDRGRVMDVYLVPLLSALLEMRRAVGEWEGVVGESRARDMAAEWEGLKKAVEQGCVRMAVGLKDRMRELELPAKHRDAIEQLLRALHEKRSEEVKR